MTTVICAIFRKVAMYAISYNTKQVYLVFRILTFQGENYPSKRIRARSKIKDALYYCIIKYDLHLGWTCKSG